MAFGEFFCGLQRVVRSGQDSSILPARVANHTARFGSSCPLTELAKYNNKNAYGIFAFFKTFLASSFFWRISLSKLTSSGFLSSLFVLLFLDLRENWSKLIETLQTLANED